MLEYKGYTGRVTVFDEKQGIITGRVLGIRDIVNFAGKTSDELIQAFHDSVDDYLEWCTADGDEAEKPYSGKVVVRMTSALHHQIEEAVHRADITMNSWMVNVLEDFLARNFPDGNHRATAKPISARR